MRPSTCLDIVRSSYRRCTCPHGPFYYVVVRQGDASNKEPVGRDRRLAKSNCVVSPLQSRTAITGRDRPLGLANGLTVGWPRLSASGRPSARIARRSLTLRRRSEASASDELGRRTLRASTGSCVSAAAHHRPGRNTCACSALVCRQPSSTGTQTRMRFANYLRHRGPARSGRRRPTLRTTSSLDSSHTFGASRSERCAWSL